MTKKIIEIPLGEGGKGLARSYTILKTIMGDLYIVAENNLLVRIYIGKDSFVKGEGEEILQSNGENEVLQQTRQQLKEYFLKKRQHFDLPMAVSGTPFQQSVWEALMEIPYGETKSYADIAERIHHPKAVRAVGQANKANRLPIVIPCHRVIGKNKQLTGYAGKQVHLKEKLLILEGIIPSE